MTTPEPPPVIDTGEKASTGLSTVSVRAENASSPVVNTVNTDAETDVLVLPKSGTAITAVELEEKMKQYALANDELERTILTLNLSVAQIEHSMTEGDTSVLALIDSFKYMSKQMEQLQISAHALDLDDREGLESMIPMIRSSTEELSGKITQAIMAFQFYDRLNQRLEHVERGLSLLAEIVSDEMQVKDDGSWVELRQTIQDDIAMKEEEELFELIYVQKLPARQAIETMKARMAEQVQAQTEEDIELF